MKSVKQFNTLENSLKIDKNTQKQNNSVSLLFLKATLFCTGGVIMIVELLGTKIIAPYFGSSLYTWTSLIATTMISLSLGYHWGGKFSDNSLEHKKLYGIILFAGVALIIAPFLQIPVLKISSSLGLRAGSLTASMILFAVPLFLLGMVTPYSVKLAFRETAHLGQTVGGLYAVSTIGSLIGTIVTGFFLIPNFGNIQILTGCAALLFILSGVFFLQFRIKKLTFFSFFLALSSFLFSNISFSGTLIKTNTGSWELIYRTNSNYGNLSVIDHYDSDKKATSSAVIRGVYNDGLCQNQVETKSGCSISNFSYILRALSSLYFEKPSNVLCIGTGIGVLPMEFAQDGAKVDAIEINPKMTGIAQKYFNYKHPNITDYFEDGRYFLNKSTKKYDIIVLDAFLGEATPSHLLTLEMFQTAKQHMENNSVLVINFFGARTGESHTPVEALYSTLKKVFPCVGAFAKNTNDVTGVFFFASNHQPGSDLKLKTLPHHMIPVINEIMTHPVVLNENSNLILKDNYNPIEIIDIPTKEKIRKRIQNTNLTSLY